MYRSWVSVVLAASSDCPRQLLIVLTAGIGQPHGMRPVSCTTLRRSAKCRRGTIEGVVVVASSVSRVVTVILIAFVVMGVVVVVLMGGGVVVVLAVVTLVGGGWVETKGGCYWQKGADLTMTNCQLFGPVPRTVRTMASTNLGQPRVSALLASTTITSASFIDPLHSDNLAIGGSSVFLISCPFFHFLALLCDTMASTSAAAPSTSKAAHATPVNIPPGIWSHLLDVSPHTSGKLRKAGDLKDAQWPLLCHGSGKSADIRHPIPDSIRGSDQKKRSDSCDPDRSTVHGLAEHWTTTLN
ncbi:hypothetical protein BDZ89DRAFT_1049738 [Hymenopellis radicata]|nr:hypothetical protein BDZ89DRAFT_1049738 [Hymenopellis radicata]